MVLSTAKTMPLVLPPPTLNIAITGCGIAGLTAAIALLKHPHIQVTIYEQASELREIGASIGLGPNGLRSLEKLGIENALGDDVCFRYEDKDWPMIYRHWKTGEIIDHDVHRTVKTKKHFTARYHRAHLHQALLDNVPRERVRLGMKIVDVVAGTEGVKMVFENGEVVNADVLLGADGIHSNVRKVFVPDHRLQWSGWVALRAVFDTSRTKNIKDLPKDSAHWIGHETTFFHSKLGKEKFTIVGSFNADPEDPSAPYQDTKWNGEGDLAVLKDYYKTWDPRVQAMIAASPNIRLYPNVYGPPLPHFSFHDRVCLLGDAAHTHGGSFAAGGSLSIDDAYCLSLAVNHIFPANATSKPSPSDLKEIFRLYEATRQPHINRLLKLCIGIYGKQKEKVEAGKNETEEELLRKLKARPDPWWISEHDVERAFWEVVKREKAQPKAGDTFLARL